MNAEPWVVYLLSCSDETLYCGISNNLEKRVAAHNNGTGAKYTRGRRPVELVWKLYCSDQAEAAKFEHAIKSLTKEAKLALIKSVKSAHQQFEEIKALTERNHN